MRRKRAGKPTLIDPDLFRSKVFRFGITGQMLQQIALGGTMIALPIYLQMVLEYNAMEAGPSLAPLSLTMFATAILAGKKAGDRRPGSIIRLGFVLLTTGLVLLVPIVPRTDLGVGEAVARELGAVRSSAAMRVRRMRGARAPWSSRPSMPTRCARRAGVTPSRTGQYTLRCTGLPITPLPTREPRAGDGWAGDGRRRGRRCVLPLGGRGGRRS